MHYFASLLLYTYLCTISLSSTFLCCSASTWSSATMELAYSGGGTATPCQFSSSILHSGHHRWKGENGAPSLAFFSDRTSLASFITSFSSFWRSEAAALISSFCRYKTPWKSFMNHHIMLLSDTYRVDLQENRGVALLLQQPRPPLAISLLQKVAYVFDSNYFFLSPANSKTYIIRM